MIGLLIGAIVAIVVGLRARRRVAGRTPGARVDRRDVKVSFLIPAYNEAATIGEVLERIAGLDLDSQVIVVDDGSTDATAAIAEAAGRDRDPPAEPRARASAIRTAIAAGRRRHRRDPGRRHGVRPASRCPS